MSDKLIPFNPSTMDLANSEITEIIITPGQPVMARFTYEPLVLVKKRLVDRLLEQLDKGNN